MTNERDMSQLPEDWALALENHGFDRVALRALVSDIYDGSEGAVYPERRDVFRAFHLTSLEEVQVVVLGQDPYPKHGEAHGLAFSAPTTVPVPRSLKAIYSNLENDPAFEFVRPATGDLTPWTSQGVLLLNTALTVAEGRPGSHARQWRSFTDLVLRVIDVHCAHVAFLLWGAPAIRKADSIPINEELHKTIRSTHPAAWGKSKEPRFRTTRPFSEANDFLKSHGPSRPTWELPTPLDG